jgi:hypothetical protein
MENKAISVAAPAVLSREVEERLRAFAEAIPDPEIAAAYLRAAKGAFAWRELTEKEKEEKYLDLAVENGWPTVAEMDDLLTGLIPAKQQKIRGKAADALQKKIMAFKRSKYTNPGEILSFRGDLRRLALVNGDPPTKESLGKICAHLGLDMPDL